MAYNFPQGFQVTSQEPIDSRLVMTKEEMLNIKKPNMPSVYFCICSDDGDLYLYNKENTIDPVIGRFRKIKSSNSSNILDAGDVKNEDEDSIVFNFKHGTAEDWSKLNPVLGLGEPGFEEDTNSFKIGNGETHWNDLEYYTSEKDVISTDQIKSLFN